jgi:hypothetical protein
MTITQKFILVPVLALTVLGGGAALGYASLSEAERGPGNRGMMGRFDDHSDHLRGAITALNGSSLTLKGVNGTTYTVDGQGAEVDVFMSNGKEDAEWSTLAIGDRISVHGSIEGTTVKATEIKVGDLSMRGGMHGKGRDARVGEVTGKDGSTLTVTLPNGSTVSVDAGDAKVRRLVDGSLDDVNVGDRIGVHGERDGDRVKADGIMDDVPDRGKGWDDEGDDD